MTVDTRDVLLKAAEDVTQVDDYRQASQAVNRHTPLIAFNDSLPDDPFTAGQQLAELFRTTAESL